MCMLFIGGWITWTAYKPVHLAVVAMDTRAHVLSLSSSGEQDSTDLEVQVFRDIQWNIVLQRHSAKLQLQGTRITQQAGIVLTQTPSLIRAGGNNVHWPISINPSRCQTPHLLLLQGYSAPLPPPLLPSHSLFFYMKKSPFLFLTAEFWCFGLFYFNCFFHMTALAWASEGIQRQFCVQILVFTAQTVKINAVQRKQVEVEHLWTCSWLWHW